MRLKSEWDGIKLCFSFMGRYKAIYWILVIGSLCMDYTAQIGLALLNRNVINSVLNSELENFKGIIIFAGVIILLYALRSLINYFRMYSIRLIMRDLRIKLFDHMEKLSVGYFEKNHSGDSIFRLNSNVENMKRAYTMYSNNIVGGFGGGIISCIFIIFMDWRLGCISIITCALTVMMNMRFAPGLRTIGRNIQRMESELVSRLSDMLSGIRVIKLYRSGETATERYKLQNEKTAAARITRIDRSSKAEAANRMMEFINNFVLITIGALMSVFGITDLGTVFAILSIQGNVSAMFMNFGSAWGMVQESISAAEMIEEVFEAVPENYENTTVEKRNSSIAVRFENVIFAYDKEKVLDGISLEVRRGETAALVGNSGGGKSTVIRLMPEFYKICSGHIYIDGADIKSYPLKQLRSKIAYVPQDSYLFEETIMENIRFGKPDASDKEVYEAARLANAHDFIKELPEGYNTITGERGETLSGGQRQRIAIARAFLKDAPILLLDEATSALDKENERLVQQSLETLMRGRTTMVVAHRLSTIRNADVIYVIKNGHVIQKGKHNDLLKEGLYRELVELSERTDGREADRYV